MKKRGKDKKVWLHFIFFSRNVFNQMPYSFPFSSCYHCFLPPSSLLSIPKQYIMKITRQPLQSSLPLPNSLICVARSFQKDELLVMKAASTQPFSPMFAGLDISKRNHKVSFNSGQGKRSIRKRDPNNLLLIRLTFTLLCFLHLECTSLLKVSCIVDPILTQFNTKLLHSLAISFLVVGIVRS